MRSSFHATTGFLAASLLAALFACEEQSAPPPSAQGQAAGTPSGGGAFSSLAENPTSIPGKSARMAKNLEEKIGQRDDESLAMAAAMSGEGQTFSVAGLSFTAPGEWQKGTPSSTMRAAEFTVKPDENAADPEATASLVFFFFGKGQGGDPDANIQRWKSQMTDDFGQPVDAKVRARNVQGLSVTTVAMEGTYLDGMPGAEKTPRSGFAFRGAIFEGPGGNVFAKFTGPTELIESAENGWNMLVASVKAE